jgi:hypothetical protein
MIFITILTWLVCNTSMCHTESVTVPPEALAIATCESGDTVTLGTANWTAINTNVDGTIDSGAWQFNDYWVWSSDDTWAIRPVANTLDESSQTFLQKYPIAAAAPPHVQYAMFAHIWDNGYGWKHWSASKPCWSQWLTINKKGQAVMR